MKMSLKQRQFDFKNIPKVHTMVNRVADIITKDIKDGVVKGEDLEGKQFKKLDPATIRSKRRKRKNKPRSATPTKPLMDTHKMVGKGGATGGVYVKARASKTTPRAEIGLSKDRQEVAIYHNEGKGNLPVRMWWGISDRVEKKLQTAINEWFRLLYKVGIK
jgi:hypothetical protein